MRGIPLHPSSGTGIITGFKKSIRFVRLGCANRPFFHIIVADKRKGPYSPPIEQLGSYDPMPNMYNEKLVALNLERIQYWMGQGASISKQLAELLGHAGFLPIHPRAYMSSWKTRNNLPPEEDAAKQASMKE